MLSSFHKILTVFKQKTNMIRCNFIEENIFLKHTMTVSKIELPRVSYLLVGHDRTRNATSIDRRK